MRHTPRDHPGRTVAVCVDKGRSYGRRLLAGIARYVETFGRWSLYIDPQADGTYAADWLKGWHGDGVLVYVESPKLAERLRRSGIPAVELFGHRRDLRLPQVANDEAAIGRLAADHLLERQFKQFAFSGYPAELWSVRRAEGFKRRVGDAGFGCDELLCGRYSTSLSDWERTQRRLAEWLAALPKPVGVMACSDRHAQRLLEACRRAGIDVPEQIAVIGVDNDEETCRLSDPPLTSVIDDAPRIGFEAARLLDALMAGTGDHRQAAPILIPPAGIATRRSTDVTAIDDALVADALRRIRLGACSGLNVDALLQDLGVSRSTLYRRFESTVGRSPHEQITRVRIDRVRQLLGEPELTIEQIARLTGFAHAEYLSVAFRRETGLWPGEHRRRQSANAAE